MNCDTWHETRDSWHVTCDMLWGMNILSKFQLPSSSCFWFMILWRSGGKGSPTLWMSDEAVYRTAPATQGLLKTGKWELLQLRDQSIFSTRKNLCLSHKRTPHSLKATYSGTIMAIITGQNHLPNICWHSWKPAQLPVTIDLRQKLEQTTAVVVASTHQHPCCSYIIPFLCKYVVLLYH